MPYDVGGVSQSSSEGFSEVRRPRRRQVPSEESEDEPEVVDTDEEIEHGEDLGGHSADERDAAEEGSDETDEEDWSDFLAPEGPIPGPSRLRRCTNAQPTFESESELDNISLSGRPVRKSRKAKASAPALPPEYGDETTVTDELIERIVSSGSYAGILPLPLTWTWRQGPDVAPLDPDFQWQLPDEIQGEPAGARWPRRVFGTCLTPSLEEAVKIMRWGMEKCKFCSIGHEICPETGRPHIHVYWHHTDTKSLRVMKTAFPRMNFQTCGGTEAQCRAYTSKDGFGLKIHEAEFACGAGKRRDLHACGQLLLSDGVAGLDEIANSNPAQYIRYYRGMEALLTRTIKPRCLSQPPTVTWIMGDPGSGKSYLARRLSSELIPQLGPVFEMNHLNLPWVESYNQERICCIQDLRAVTAKGQRIEPSFFLKMWDVDAMLFERKGGSVQFQGEAFFVTCCIHPSEFYSSGNGIDNPLQFLRRITRIIVCEAVGETVETATFSHKDIKRGPMKNPWPLGFEFV